MSVTALNKELVVSCFPVDESQYI